MPEDVETGASSEAYLSVIGNHSHVLRHDKIRIPAGEAVIVLNKRTQSAAAHSKTAQMEYWAVLTKHDIACSVRATFTGSARRARHEFLELLNNWRISK
ncbi:MAG: hypothetical protein ACE3JK_17660 [Sporolactobacillus sp.]